MLAGGGGCCWSELAGLDEERGMFVVLLSCKARLPRRCNAASLHSDQMGSIGAAPTFAQRMVNHRIKPFAPSVIVARGPVRLLAQLSGQATMPELAT